MQRLLEQENWWDLHSEEKTKLLLKSKFGSMDSEDNPGILNDRNLSYVESFKFFRCNFHQIASLYIKLGRYNSLGMLFIG